MTWIRYLLYFSLITAIMALLARLEIAYPGSLRLQVFTEATGSFGTSEFSPVEMIQPLILLISGLIMARVAISYTSQRPVAFVFGGVALTFIILELDYFLDRYLIRNLWLVLVGICIALVIAYAYRQRKRIKIAWADSGRLRHWRSCSRALS